jgi:Transposase
VPNREPPDLGKNTFHLVGLDRRGAVVLQQKVTRGQLERRLANIPRCLIGMEACSGSHHIGRRLAALGHDVRLIPAQYVKPFLKGHKNDYRDAEAIAEAVQRMNESCLISDSEAWTMPRTATLSAIFTLYVVWPSRDLTVSIGPSTPSTVPRTRTVDDCCWAKVSDVASSRAKLAAPKARRVIWSIVISGTLAGRDECRH